MPKVGVNFRRRSPLRRGQFCTPVYKHGIDVISPSLVQRTAFAELFAYGGDLVAMKGNAQAVKTSGNIDAAIINAKDFMEAVYERIK